MSAEMGATKRARAPRLSSGGPIRDAAASLFLEKGYQGTSMDEIAALAGVSKQTIYTHFPNKEVLFQDLVLGNAGRVDEFTAEIQRTFDQGSDLSRGLRDVARLYMRFVIRPEVLRLRRLVLGEAGRFPGLAQRYYELVPERVYQALADLFRQLTDRGLLSVDDATLAAHHFAWLVLGLPLDAAMFDDNRVPAPDELDRLADAAARVFIAAYTSKK